MLAASRTAGRPGFHAGTPAQARSLLAESCAALGPGPGVGAVTSLAVPTRGGGVPARLFSPTAPARGRIVYIHGGGWVLGSLDDFETVARALAARSGFAVLLVDYRLAPEHPFPAGLQDVEDVVFWAADPRSRLPGRDGPLIVAGDSAGANLATVALAAPRARPDVALQLLFYPVADCDMDRDSYRAFADGLFLTRADMRWFYGHYAPEPLWADPRISPLRTPDLAGSPPAFVATAEFDVLRDEAEAYAGRLEKAGVSVALRRYAGLSHGFIRMINLVPAADRALDDAVAAIVATA